MIAGAFVVWQIALLVSTGPVGDEIVHLNQAVRFAHGYFKATTEMTQIPGYHLVVAAVMALIDESSILVGRAVGLFALTLAVWAFAGIRRRLFPGELPQVATLQLVFLPVLFPYAWLFYTDVPALALVLWAFRFALDGRHGWAAGLGLAAVLTRQSSIVWVAWIGLMVAWPSLACLARRDGSWRPLLRVWPYVVPAVVFAVYWLWNGSISFSGHLAEAHPDHALSSGNIYFMLFIAALLFLPMMPTWLDAYIKRARARPQLLLIPIVGFVLYQLTFEVSNPYNYLDLNYILRNRLLVTAFVQDLPFYGMGALAVLAACALTQVRLAQPRFAWIAPFSLVVLSASDLIEQRYYIIPFALFFAVRVQGSQRSEGLLLATWAVISGVLSYGMLNRDFMI